MVPFASAFIWFRRNVLKLTIPRVCALILVLIAGTIYVPFLGNPLIFDDFNVVNGNTLIDLAFDYRLSPRWLAYATLAHTYALTEGSIPAMRWGNLLLHAATVVAVFTLLRELCLAVLDPSGADRQREIRTLAVASVGAALFALHPVAVYGVGYLVQRTIIMATLFMVLMLIAYLRWLMEGRRALWVWAAVWYLMSVLSKEHSVAAPAVALLLTFVLHRPSWALVRGLVPAFITFGTIAIWVTLKVKGVIGEMYEPYASDMVVDVDERLGNVYALSAVTQSFLFFKYFLLWVLPNVNWMSIDMREPLARSLWSWPYGIAAMTFLAYPLFAIYLVLRRGRAAIAGWILAVPWLMFVTELSTVRVQEPFVLYRSYLWFPLLGGLVGLAFYRCSVKWVATFVVSVLCVFAALSWNRLDSLSDTLRLWEDAARLLKRGDESGAARIYYNRGLELSKLGRREEAIAELDRALKLNPRQAFAQIHFTRARINYELKRYDEAMQDINTSIALDPKRSSLYFSRGSMLRREGKITAALDDFKKGCDLKDVMACYAYDQVKMSMPK